MCLDEQGWMRRNLRIEIALLPLRGAREQLEAAIARANMFPGMPS